MFGTLGLANLPPKVKVAPEDVPPPTPICLPRYQPFVQDDAPVDPQQALSNLLKYTGRASAASGSIGLSAIGFDLKLDVETHGLIPVPSFIPDFEKWDRLTPEEAREQNQAERRPIRNGNLSPGCQVYVERRRELSTTNEDAFRTVRRLAPPKGRQQARLGNTYEFFRCLEFFTTYWEDPSRPPSLPPSTELAPTENGETNTAQGSVRHQVTRSSDGSSMPPEYRQNLISAFVKLVAYDFGCNVSMARVEPRLQLSSPEGHPNPRKSYSPSNCHFLFQSPTTRETARAGLVYGPLAAVSTRPGVNFTTPDIETAQSTDLAREVLAALITAQHRAREGKTEIRFGEDQWWTSKPRWGGGTGGPIGREIDTDAPLGDKGAAPADPENAVRPPAKRPRKTMSIYDAYRMVRPPALTWDKKARYEAVGRQKGVNYDDVFVISSIFHHVSILRVRVPDRLLEVLGGSPDPEATRRSWDRVQGWRSRWFDLFDTEQRLEAMQMLWAVMAYQMRKEPEEKDVVTIDK
ncbi:hypothetical protein Trco_005396 [Trichoderma cornu-damae]|uniref:Uncharacterized protein n=1 Tax=Trichoderma cornu-damae TaxID=654480 RepID=A0A9P8QND6_9HYPO|nr:hypothetical protein Trco_005396 [Trichoderma cornu-damae]